MPTPLHSSRVLVRPALAAALTLAAGVAVVSSADAHVKVFPATAVAGDYPTLTFRVPTESATASTTRLEVDLPADHPFGSVSYQPVPGWTTVVTTSRLTTPVTTDDGTITEAPTKIVWTASAGAAIRPGQFQTFAVTAGPVPDASSVRFTAVQTYSDGSVVRWDQPVVAGKDEPDHPAPTLTITKAPASAAAPAAPATPSTPSTGTTPPAAGAADASTGGDGAATWYGVAGIALAAVALVVAVRASRVRRG